MFISFLLILPGIQLIPITRNINRVMAIHLTALIPCINLIYGVLRIAAVTPETHIKLAIPITRITRTTVVTLNLRVTRIIRVIMITLIMFISSIKCTFQWVRVTPTYVSYLCYAVVGPSCTYDSH